MEQYPACLVNRVLFLTEMPLCATFVPQELFQKRMDRQHALCVNQDIPLKGFVVQLNVQHAEQVNNKLRL